MSIADKLNQVLENTNKVYQAGALQSFHDTFWDQCQQNGNRTNYEMAFAGEMWDNDFFKPKYDLNITTGYMMFRNSKIKEIFDVCDSLGIKINTSNATTLRYAFQNNYTTRAGIVDMSNCTTTHYAFYSTSYKTIEKIICTEKTVFNTYTFNSLINLEEIRFEGIISNSTNITSKKLSKASIESTLNALSSTTTGQTLTVSKTAVKSAYGDDYENNSEWINLINSKSNWTITLSA